GRISRRGESIGAADWRTWVDASDAFSRDHRTRSGFARRRNAPCPNIVLVWNFRPRIVDLCLDRFCPVARRARWIRERDPAHGALGDVHVDRPHRPDLVRLRLGNPTPRNRFPVNFSLSAYRRAAISNMRPTDPGHLAVPLAGISDHG